MKSTALFLKFFVQGSFTFVDKKIGSCQSCSSSRQKAKSKTRQEIFANLYGDTGIYLNEFSFIKGAWWWRHFCKGKIQSYGLFYECDSCYDAAWVTQNI